MNAGAGGGGWDVVAAVQRGDREAFGLLYGRYEPVVARFVRSRVRDWALAQDLTSETFTRAWRSVGAVRPLRADVGAWLVTIARHLVCDHAKSYRCLRERLTAQLDQYAGAELSAEQVLLASEARAELAGQLARLPVDQQRVIRLRFGHELSIRQTAVVLGRTEGAVKALQQRGITQLRIQLTGRHPRPRTPAAQPQHQGVRGDQ